MTHNLLPCPFCGDDEIMDFQAHLENRVQCAMCNVSTDTFPSCEESHAAWNTRTKAAPTEPQSDVHPLCRERLRVEGKAYPRSGCEVCGKWSPKSDKCRAMLGGSHDPAL